MNAQDRHDRAHRMVRKAVEAWQDGTLTLAELASVIRTSGADEVTAGVVDLATGLVYQRKRKEV